MRGVDRFPLDDRLRAVLELVPPGSRVADVGCDHARLTIALLQSGRCERVIASDLRPGPLQTAQRNLTAAGLLDKTSLRLCDGLDGVAAGEVDCAVMAGMGGLLMLQIIDRAAWLRDPAVCVVLQPMRDVHKVRETLWRQGYTIEEERAALANRRVYVVLRARYTGRPADPDAAACYLGLLPQGGVTERCRLERECRSLRKQITGLQRAGDAPDRLKQLTAVYDRLEREIVRMTAQETDRKDV